MEVRTVAERELFEEMRRAADEFDKIPCVYRPIVTNRDALVSNKRGCPDPHCPICAGRGAR